MLRHESDRAPMHPCSAPCTSLNLNSYKIKKNYRERQSRQLSVFWMSQNIAALECSDLTTHMAEVLVSDNSMMDVL